MSFSQQQRRPPAVSPFADDSAAAAAPSFGARFNLSGESSLQQASNGGGGNSALFSEAKYAHPSTPFQRGMSAHMSESGASPFASSTPRESPSGMQSPGADRSWNAAWGAAAAAAATMSTPSNRGMFQTTTPAHKPAPSASFTSTPTASAGYGFSSSSTPAFSPPPPAHLRTPSASYTTIPSQSSRSSASNGSAAHNSAGANSSFAGARPIASAASFSHPDLERIAAQLQQVATHKTTSNLLVSLGALGLAVLLLALCLKPWPAAGLSLWGGLVTLTHNVKLLVVALATWFAYVGVSGLWRYNSAQVPLKELEGLSEKQRRLMGWTGGSGIGSREREQGQGRDNNRPGQDRNALRARARVQQLTAPSADMSASRTPSSSQLSSSIASRVLSPIPSASLRFLGASPPPMGRATAAESSPFKMRGLDSASSAASAGRINDERGLSSFVHEFDARHRTGASTDLNQTSPSHSNLFGTPARSVSGLSPRNSGFGGLFGFASSAPATPPYATSLREAPTQIKSASALALGSSSMGGGAAGFGSGLSATGGMSTFSFHLPGHRFALDDPRADSDLHETFHTQLRSPLRTSAHVVDQWTRNMRTWIVQQVLRPFLQQLDVSNAAMARFASFVLQQAGVAQVFREDELQLLRELAQAFSSSSSASPPLLTARHEEAVWILCSRFGSRQEVQQRLALEKFLAVEHKSDSATVPAASSSLGLFGSSPAAVPAVAAPAVSASTRAYVAQRLQTLCAPGDDALSKFSLGAVGAASVRTNPFVGLFGTRSSGGVGVGAAAAAAAASASAAPSVASPFPSDANLILHCWCTHMESVQSNFTQQYIKSWNANTLTHAQLPASATATAAASSRSPSSSSGAELSAIAQVRSPSLAPYFVVTHASSAPGGSRREGVGFVTEPGRASLFQAMVLWILDLPRGSTMRREFDGIIQN